MTDIAIHRDFRTDKATITPLTNAGAKWIRWQMETEARKRTMQVPAVRVDIEAVQELEELMEKDGLSVEVQ